MNPQSKQNTLTTAQQAVANEIETAFDLEPNSVLFLNPDKPEDPWLPPGALVQIARTHGDFHAIDEGFDQFIEPLKQVVHRATVTDKDGRVFSRTGIATISEDASVDPHVVAGGRALSATLTAAGFNPLKRGSVVPFDNQRRIIADTENPRRDDLRRIHALATEKGFIVALPSGVKDMTAYRRFLAEHYNGVRTAGNFDALQRQSLIELLLRQPSQQEPNEFDELEDLAA